MSANRSRGWHQELCERSVHHGLEVDRWHKTLRREFLDGKVFISIEDAQAQVDGWVREYNFERRHQGIGDVVPWERFRLAADDHSEPVEPTTVQPLTTCKVGRHGKISFASELYKVGVWLAVETVEVSVGDGLVSIHHRSVLVATHAQRHQPVKETKALARKAKPQRQRPRQATVGQTVTRKVDSSGNVSSPPPATASVSTIAAVRYRSPSSTKPWRSHPAVRSSKSIRSATTGQENTEPSPTQAAK